MICKHCRRDVDLSRGEVHFCEPQKTNDIRVFKLYSEEHVSNLKTDYEARITELLKANNAEVEARRKWTAKVNDLEKVIDKLTYAGSEPTASALDEAYAKGWTKARHAILDRFSVDFTDNHSIRQTILRTPYIKRSNP